MGHWTTTSSLVHIVWNTIIVYIAGFYFFGRQFVRKHNKPTALENRQGNVAIVTGGAKGIGLEIVRQLLSKGFHTIIAASSPECDSTLSKLREEFPLSNVEYCQVDITNDKSIHQFAVTFIQRRLPLHLLVNNAGVMFTPYKLNENGIESQLSTNYLGHFLLTYLLLPCLIDSGTEKLKSRIVSVTSCGHYAGRINFDDLNSKEYYSACGSYAQSKLAQVMHTILLQELLNKRKAFTTVNCVHPGIINTELYKHSVFKMFPFIVKLFFKTPEQGADGVIYVALSKEIEGIGGKYFDNCEINDPKKTANDRELQVKLWKKSCEILELKDFDPPL